MERITMSMCELDRYKGIQEVADGRLKPWRAAERLALTTRQIRRFVGRAQAQARTLANLLGRKERLKRACCNHRRYPGACIGDADPDVRAQGAKFPTLPVPISTVTTGFSPSGMASRALTARFSSAASNRAASSNTILTSWEFCMSISMAELPVRCRTDHMSPVRPDPAHRE
jgi:hypothetical protein